MATTRDETPTAFHVQGRRTRRDCDGGARDDVRLADAATRSDAFGIANAWRRDGYTIWVWEKADTPSSADLCLLDTLPPAPDGTGEIVRVRTPWPGRGA